MKTVGIAYLIDPLVEKRLRETPRDELIKKAIEQEKGLVTPGFTTREEFEKWAEEEAKSIGITKEERINLKLRRVIHWEIISELKKIEDDWDTKAIVDKKIAYFKENKIPYFIKVFENTNDKTFALEETKWAFKRVKKKDAPAESWVIPDFEEDPPKNFNPNEEKIGKIVAIIGLAGVAVAAVFILGAVTAVPPGKIEVSGARVYQ